MRAMTLHTYGGPLTLEDVSTPAITDERVLVKVSATTVNHLDLVKASGAAKQFFPIDLPWVPGHELSGVVERVGRAVKGFSPGDAVFGFSDSGAYADDVAVKPAAIVKKPANLSHEEAASVPVAAVTAWQGVFTHGHLAKGQTVLIHGGAGAVGAYAVQFAAQVGANVIVTATGDDEGYLKSIGATRIIDFRKARFENELADKVDVVFDLIGGETQDRSFQVLKKGGYLIAANQPVSEEQATRHGVTGLMMSVAQSQEDLSRIAGMLAEGKLRADVATVYSLADAPRAWAEMAGGPAAATKTRRAHGKVVIRIA